MANAAVPVSTFEQIYANDCKYGKQKHHNHDLIQNDRQGYHQSLNRSFEAFVFTD